MKLVFIKIILFSIFFSGYVYSDGFESTYEVSSSGVKIGIFNWALDIDGGKYESKIKLKSKGLLSPLYKFEGEYVSKGYVKNNFFNTTSYKQFWKTKNKTKVIAIKFRDGYVLSVHQKPKENEAPRVDLKEIKKYYDPITSIINILYGHDDVKTIDGRRVYIFKKNISSNQEKLIFKIIKYQNIWADHKRNDLNEVGLFLEKNTLLPTLIEIDFKGRIFKLKKI